MGFPRAEPELRPQTIAIQQQEHSVKNLTKEHE